MPIGGEVALGGIFVVFFDVLADGLFVCRSHWFGFVLCGVSLCFVFVWFGCLCGLFGCVLSCFFVVVVILIWVVCPVTCPVWWAGVVSCFWVGFCGVRLALLVLFVAVCCAFWPGFL